VSGDMSSPALESLARVSLVQNDLDQAGEYLARQNSLIRTPADRTSHVNRYTELARIELLHRQGAYSDAYESSLQMLDIANMAGDRLLLPLVQLQRAGLLATMGKPSDFVSIVASLSGEVANYPEEVQAQYERT